jgi:hypothetical protein
LPFGSDVCIVSNSKYFVMDDRKDIRKDPNKTIIVLLVIFFAIILRDGTTGTLNSTWVTLMGGIIVCLSFTAMLLHGRKGGNIPKDR